MDHIIDSGWSPNMVFSPYDCTIRWFFCISWWPETSTNETHKVVVKQTWSRILRGSFASHARHQWILGELDYQIYWKRRSTDISSIGHQCCHPAPVTSAWLTCAGFMWHVCVVWWDCAKGLLGDTPSLLVGLQSWQSSNNDLTGRTTTNHIELFQTNVLPHPTPQKAQECLYQCHLCLDLESAVLFFTSPAGFWKMCLCTKYQMDLNRSLQTCSCIVANDSHKIRNAATFWDICVYLYLLVYLKKKHFF